MRKKKFGEKQLDSPFSGPLFASWFGTAGIGFGRAGDSSSGGKQKRPDRINSKRLNEAFNRGL